MPSTYPGALDALATDKTDGTASAGDHPAHHNDLADAINKIEAELGVNHSLSQRSAIAARTTRGLPGLVVPQWAGWIRASAPPVASRCFFHRVLSPRAMSIASLGLLVNNVATTDDQIDWGLYDATGAAIFRKGATAGMVNGGPGVTSLPMAATLAAESVYYVGFAYGPAGGTAASLGLADWSGLGNLPFMFGATAGVAELAIAAGVFPLPAQIAFAASGFIQAPILAIRE
jgi:hypothetical protein